MFTTIYEPVSLTVYNRVPEIEQALIRSSADSTPPGRQCPARPLVSPRLAMPGSGSLGPCVCFRLADAATS
eukprot:86138-Hanusia_phi.AAC.2